MRSAGVTGESLAVKLVGGFPHQLFYREFSTVDDHAPLADVARCEVLRGADNRVVRQGFESRVSQVSLLYYYTYYHYYWAWSTRPVLTWCPLPGARFEAQSARGAGKPVGTPSLAR